MHATRLVHSLALFKGRTDMKFPLSAVLSANPFFLPDRLC